MRFHFQIRNLGVTFYKLLHINVYQQKRVRRSWYRTHHMLYYCTLSKNGRKCDPFGRSLDPCKNSHISQKWFYSCMRWFFKQFKKGLFHKTVMEMFFLIYWSHGVFKNSYNHSSMYYNLQETLHSSYVVALEYRELSLPLMLR